MLQAQFFFPSKEAGILVDRYVFLKASDEPEPFRDRFIPDGHVGIVYHFGGRFTAIINHQEHPLPVFFFTRPRKSSLIIKVEPPADTMIVICKASVFSRFLGLDMSHQKEQMHVQFEQPLHLESLKLVFEVSEPQERITAFEQALQQIGTLSFYQPDLLDKVYQEIMQSKGNEKVAMLSSRFSVNPRTLRRKFITRIGIPPKELAEVVRVHYLWSQIIQNPALDIFDVVCEGGFYDQPHFIRNFQKIVGETPSAFFKRNHENALAFSAKKG